MDNKKKKERKYEINSYKKSNLLISAKYKSTLMENKIQAIALESINHAVENEAGNLECTFSASKLREIFGDDKGSLYRQLKMTANKMMASKIGYEEKNGFEYINMVSKASYKDGVFKIVFNGELKKEIYNLQTKFTILNLSTMMKFDSVYSFRLYEYIKSEKFKIMYNNQERLEGMGYEMEIPSAEIRLLMGTVDSNEPKVREILSKGKKPDYDKAIKVATEQKFKAWKEFKRSVIDVAVKEINEKTDIYIESKTIRAGIGGKAVGIKFVVYDKENDKIVENNNNEITENEVLDKIDAVRKIIKENITSRDITAILKVADYDLEKIIKAYEISKNQNIKNITGWMINAIKNDYMPGQESKANNSFNDFEQNDYDFDELEKMIVDN